MNAISGWQRWLLALTMSLPGLVPASPEQDGVDVRLEHVRQRFADSDGSTSTLMLSPYLRWQDDWELRLDIPLLNAEGDYQLDSMITPRLERLCRLRVTRPELLQRLLDSGRIRADTLAQCDAQGALEEDANSGAGDVTLWINRLLAAGDHALLMVQAGYKHDNGAIEEGLGTGTRDVMLEVGGSRQWGRLGGFMMAGYDHVLAQYADDLQDYAYASAELGWKWSPAFETALRYRHEQAQADSLDALRSLTLQLGWRFSERYSARMFLQRFRDSDSWPEQEAGVSVTAAF